MSTQVLLVECDDRRGLVHAVTGVLLQHGVNVVGNQEFVERGAGRFFMRTEFDGELAPGQLVGEQPLDEVILQRAGLDRLRQIDSRARHPGRQEMPRLAACAI